MPLYRLREKNHREIPREQSFLWIHSLRQWLPERQRSRPKSTGSIYLPLLPDENLDTSYAQYSRYAQRISIFFMKTKLFLPFAFTLQWYIFLWIKIKDIAIWLQTILGYTKRCIPTRFRQWGPLQLERFKTRDH